MLINANRHAFQVGDSELITWPERTAIEIFHQQPVMGLVRFHDTAAYHSTLSDYITRQAADPRAARPLPGGAYRLDGLLEWPLAEAELINTRALKLCMDLMHSERCRIDDAYALLLGERAYLPLQEPGMAVASVVYLLEPGEADPATGNGRLSFTHRQLGLSPVQAPAHLAPGTLIAHPAAMRLAALPYSGQIPRILLIWHIAL
ncbi:MAG: hypothetical protein H6970_13060 [Gammaproteobacteria bacterium]|nr:hypothetical protein [Gammaproteobacteria bacterium]MCP5458835.1 hypothetical protein [Gammaproteobacteria bacterium]